MSFLNLAAVHNKTWNPFEVVFYGANCAWRKNEANTGLPLWRSNEKLSMLQTLTRVRQGRAGSSSDGLQGGETYRGCRYCSKVVKPDWVINNLYIKSVEVTLTKVTLEVRASRLWSHHSHPWCRHQCRGRLGKGLGELQKPMFWRSPGSSSDFQASLQSRWTLNR